MVYLTTTQKREINTLCVNAWDNATGERREELIKSLGFHHSFSSEPRFNNLGNRSGGWLQEKIRELMTIKYIKMQGL